MPVYKRPRRSALLYVSRIGLVHASPLLTNSPPRLHITKRYGELPLLQLYDNNDFFLSWFLSPAFFIHLTKFMQPRQRGLAAAYWTDWRKRNTANEIRNIFFSSSNSSIKNRANKKRKHYWTFCHSPSLFSRVSTLHISSLGLPFNTGNVHLLQSGLAAWQRSRAASCAHNRHYTNIVHVMSAETKIAVIIINIIMTSWLKAVVEASFHVHKEVIAF